MNRKKAEPQSKQFARMRDIKTFRRTLRKISGDVILIVCDGEKTEPYYFNELRKIWKISSAQVDVVRGNKKDPTNIIERAIKLRDDRKKDAKKEIAVEFDQIWCVFDNDNRTKTVIKAIQEAEKEGFKCALSTPCFEIWYLLHCIYTTSPFRNYTELVRELKKHYPQYDKVECNIQFWIEKLKTALSNASKLRNHNNATGSINPATDVDLLVDELINLRRTC